MAVRGESNTKQEHTILYNSNHKDCRRLPREANKDADACLEGGEVAAAAIGGFTTNMPK